MRARLGLLNIGVKVALILLLLHAVVFPDLPQYVGKGIGSRLLLYPLSGIVVPFIWLALGNRRSHIRYPQTIDICVVLPFLLDTAGNAANLYDTIAWWDDVMHFVTWIPWVTAAGLALRYCALGRINTGALTVGFGAVTHILWEIGEYFAFVQGNPSELSTAYRDTIGDLLFSLSGSVLGGVLIATVLWRSGTPQRSGVTEVSR